MEAKCFMHNKVNSLRNIYCAPESWRKLHWALLSSFKRDFWWNHVFCFLLTSKISAYFKFRSKAVFPAGVKEAGNTSTFFLTILESSWNPPAVFIFKKNIYVFFYWSKDQSSLKEPFLLIEKLLITYSSKHFFELNIGQGGDFGGFWNQCYKWIT